MTDQRTLTGEQLARLREYASTLFSDYADMTRAARWVAHKIHDLLDEVDAVAAGGDAANEQRQPVSIEQFDALRTWASRTLGHPEPPNWTRTPAEDLAIVTRERDAAVQQRDAIIRQRDASDRELAILRDDNHQAAVVIGRLEDALSRLTHPYQPGDGPGRCRACSHPRECEHHQTPAAIRGAGARKRVGL